MDAGYLAEFKGREAVKIAVPRLGTIEEVMASPQGQIMGKLIRALELSGQVQDVKGNMLVFRTKSQNQQVLVLHIRCEDVVSITELSSIATVAGPILVQ